MREIKDILNRQEFIDNLEVVVKIMSDNRQSSTFAIDGEWGSGKSFILERFEKQISDIQCEESSDNKYLVFHYDCWKYDYYEEPCIAIISAMLDMAEQNTRLFSLEANLKISAAWETAKKILGDIAGNFCKNKIGVDLVEIWESVNENEEIILEEKMKFDDFFSFKKTLEDTRKQLKNTVKQIYGQDADADKYLKKFISFKLSLDNGNPNSGYLEKYNIYFRKFNISNINAINDFFSTLLSGLDMRTQEGLFRKAEVIHSIICNEIVDEAIMTFEIMFLSVAHRWGNNKIYFLADINGAQHPNTEEKLGEEFVEALKEIEKKNTSPLGQGENDKIANDTIIGRTFLIFATAFNEIQGGRCQPYIYNVVEQKYVDIVRKFKMMTDVIQ